MGQGMFFFGSDDLDCFLYDPWTQNDPNSYPACIHSYPDVIDYFSQLPEWQIKHIDAEKAREGLKTVLGR